MKFYTEYLTFKTTKHREYVNITSQVATALSKSGIQEGMILVLFRNPSIFFQVK